VAQLGMPPDHIYFDALCAYHDLANNLEEELAARNHELKLLVHKGRWAAECRCRIARCRLLEQLGRPLSEELAAAREVARRLRRPAAALAELDRLVREGPV
jgi:hypothetical protein